MSLNVDPEAYQRAANYLHQGGVIAYPTEGVYGLGCDPFNKNAVSRLLTIKQRSVAQGLILIAASWSQIAKLTQPIAPEQLKKIQASWPGPYTWIFPASAKVPEWIRGQHQSIALRVTDHPQAHELCKVFKGPLVSTSANIHGQPATTDNLETYQHFGELVDYILPGRVGDLAKPTTIRDALTGNIIRQ